VTLSLCARSKKTILAYGTMLYGGRSTLTVAVNDLYARWPGIIGAYASRPIRIGRTRRAFR
jgi:hypothetical protein